MEHKIFFGGEFMITNSKERLLKLNEDFADQENLSKKILTKAGVVLKEKYEADILNADAFSNTDNQIWMKKI